MHKMTTFLSARLGSIGGIAIKGWMAAMAGVVVLTGAGAGVAYVYLSQSQVSQVPQHVFILVSGLNTTMSNCQEGSFEDPSNGGHFRDTLAQQVLGMSDPYTKGCNGDPQNWLQSPAAVALYSYRGGTMDPQRGLWIPNDFKSCQDVNNQSLQKDVDMFDQMLDRYRKIYPNARFTIIGHSLGGLVSLLGAYDYEINEDQKVIDRVITLDSPLAGVLPGTPFGYVKDLFEQANCVWNGPVTNELINIALAQTQAVNADSARGDDSLTCRFPLDTLHAGLPTCKAQALTQAGVSIVSLGNTTDSLLCGGITGQSAGLYDLCVSQVIGSNPATDSGLKYGAFTHFYTLDTSGEQSWFGLGVGHGTILHKAYTVQDIIHDALAPVVTITHPTPEETSWFIQTGTPVTYNAQIHCLWGNADPAHATAYVLDQHGNVLISAHAQPTSQTDSISISGTQTVAPSFNGASGNFVIHIVDPTGKACQYPSYIQPAAFPTNTDYLGGFLSQVPVLFDGGKLAVGANSLLYAGRPIGGVFPIKPRGPLGTPVFPGDNAINGLAWSPDGTHLAYLQNTGYQESSDSFSSLSDVYVVSSYLTGETNIAHGFHNAVALTWNSTGSQIAVLEENEQVNETYGPRLGDIAEQPSIVEVSAESGNVTKIIHLPASTQEYILACEGCSDNVFRLQWGANGVFLIGDEHTGSTLVSADGHYSELEPGSAVYLAEGAPLGALNAQGTLVAYGASTDSNTQLYADQDLNLVVGQVDAQSGTLTNPVTLGQIPNSAPNSFQSHTLVDFSVDGAYEAVCSSQKIYIYNTQSHALAQTVDLPANCEDIRWNPEGKSILVFLNGRYEDIDGFLPVGIAILPLDGSTPQILFSCGLTYSTTLQFDQNYSPRQCSFFGPKFEWQTHTK